MTPLAASRDLSDSQYDDYTWMLKPRGLRIQKPGDIGRDWDDAGSAGQPVVINARTNPDLPLPSHISYEQAKSYMASTVRSDPATWHALTRIFNTMGAELR